MLTHKYCIRCKTMRSRTEIIEFGCYDELKCASSASVGKMRIKWLEMHKNKDLPDPVWNLLEKSKEHNAKLIIANLQNEIECLKRENEMLLNAEKHDNKMELKAEYERGKRDAEQEFKNRYGILGNKSLIDHMLNQRKNIDILQRKYEKLLNEFTLRGFIESDGFIEGLHSNTKVKFTNNNKK